MLCEYYLSFLPSLPAIAAIPGPAKGNFGERNVCTGVDAQECARMANVLSVENAVLVSENAELVSENAELVGENAAMASTIAMLQSSVEIGDTEQHTLLEPMDILDQPHFRYKNHRANLHQSGTLSHILDRPYSISNFP